MRKYLTVFVQCSEEEEPLFLLPSNGKHSGYVPAYRKNNTSWASVGVSKRELNEFEIVSAFGIEGKNYEVVGKGFSFLLEAKE